MQRGDDATERLDASVSMAQRTDEIGDDILQSLQEQREKILSARCSAESMEGDMDISERKMTQMACEKCIQRWVLWVIAALFVTGLLFFLYWKIEIEPEKKRNCARDESGACESYRGRAHAQLGVDDKREELETEAFARGYEEALRRVAKDDAAAGRALCGELRRLVMPNCARLEQELLGGTWACCYDAQAGISRPPRANVQTW